jgi:hypothetical protein
MVNKMTLKEDDLDEKVKIPSSILSFLEEIGQLIYPEMRPAKAAAHVLRGYITDGMNAASRGRSTVPLPTGFLEAIRLMESRRVDEALREIDLGKLERARTAGYEGVTKDNLGWAATVLDVNGKYLRLPQRFLRPEMAAWARYQHYLQHKIPYGRYAKELAKTRNSLMAREEKWGEDYIRARAIWALGVAGYVVDPAFLEPWEAQWSTNMPQFADDVEAAKQRYLSGAPAPREIEAAPMLVLPAPKQPRQTVEEALAEAAQTRERLLQESRDARAKRLAAKYGVVENEPTDDE